MSATVEPYRRLAESVLAAPSRLAGVVGGRPDVRLVAVDGPSGAGKTEFAHRLARELDALVGAPPPVLHTDDLLDGWDDQFSFWPRLESGVLAPLRAGRAGRYQRYDWMQGGFAPEWIEVPPTRVILLEGVSAARARIRPELTRSVLVTAPAGTCLARALERDGVALRPYLERWQRRERRHFARDDTLRQVDLVVDGASAVPHDPETGYVRLPAATAGHPGTTTRFGKEHDEHRNR